MRTIDWPEKVTRFIESRRVVPFMWGENDCAIFACDALLAQTGIDYAESFRGTYSDELGAYRRLKEFGGGGLLDTAEKITRENKFWTIPPARVMVGDLVYFRTIWLGESPRDTLGIFYDDQVVCSSSKGLCFFNKLGIIKAWRPE